MTLKDQINKIVKQKKKDMKKQEKTVHLYCRKCGGSMYTGFVHEVESKEKEWHRIHDLHNKKNLFKRALEVVGYVGK